jgi:hypothetical protein
MQPERPIDASEEARLDALVRRLRSGAKTGDRDDALVDLVAELRGLDRVSGEALERHVDAVYEAHAETASRRTLVDHFAKRFERSTLFKVLAASVLAHLLALPVVAYVLLAPKPQREPDISFEPVDRSPSPIGEEPRDELDLSDAFNAALLADREYFAAAAALHTDLAARTAITSRLEDLLWMRLATIATLAKDAELAERLASCADVVGAPADEAALLELALDVHVLRPALREAVRDVVAVLAPRVGGVSAARAAAYGLGEGDADAYAGVDPAAFVRFMARHHTVDPELVRRFEQLAND